MTVAEMSPEAQTAWERLTGMGREEPEDAEQVLADAARVHAALAGGGRVETTVRSRATGKHVTVLLTAKKKRGERGWESRSSTKGRVGIGEADAVFLDDPTLEWPDGKLGFFDLGSGEWRPRRDADPARLWAAERILRWGLTGADPDALAERAEVLVALRCSSCGRKLTDPKSIERGIGPECFGKRTRSRSAERP